MQAFNSCTQKVEGGGSLSYRTVSQDYMVKPCLKNKKKVKIVTSLPNSQQVKTQHTSHQFKTSSNFGITFYIG